MDDRGEFKFPDCIQDLMSEINAKRLKEAEGNMHYLFVFGMLACS